MTPRQVTRLRVVARNTADACTKIVSTIPAGTLPRRQGLHYFKVDKTIGPDRTDYWRECEQERGIRMSIREGQIAAMERYKPALYVALKG